MLNNRNGIMLPPSLSGGDQEISMEDEVTSPTARLVTALGGEAMRKFQAIVVVSSRS